MKKLLTVIALAFALLAGTAAVMTVQLQQALADCGGSSGC
jgi:hypothetical protein